MFVATGARSRLVAERREAFRDQYVAPLLAEARKLGIDSGELIGLIRDTDKENNS
jgi:DNA-binding transcriptional regulator YhcF (GntR family)